MAPIEVDCAHKAPRGKIASKKRLIICCDGTWKNSNHGIDPPTNASRLSAAVARKCCSGMPQIVYYHPGVGSTESSLAASLLGGFSGVGIVRDIAESYRFICDNYKPEDEIILIGFSRGAFTARSVAGMVCALGFLNPSGLDQFPHIYSDYQTFENWRDEPFDEKKHLVGFTLENKKKLLIFRAEEEAKEQKQAKTEGPAQSALHQSDEALAQCLKAEKTAFYDKMRAIEGENRLELMADAYRDKLAEHELLVTCAATPGARDGKPEPVMGYVQAVGVWDTVGSLGIPMMRPFLLGRTAQEMRFVNLNVHSRVKYAFHAMALDEWRGAFECTLWERQGQKDKKDKTHLRQVWFPGSHCNVGGGFEDQQIATIALAWMADQLTSIGVAFNKAEMSRIFNHIRRGAEARKWGMGLIRNPDFVTSYPDYLWSYVTWKLPTRTPGDYFDDKGNRKLVNTNELVHPCVRIRYLYGGMELDDKGPWKSRALTERGYCLEPRNSLAINVLQRRDPNAEAVYHSVRGPVTPYYDEPRAISQDIGTDNNPFVKVEQPHESELFKPPGEPRSYWVWKHQNGSELPEEHIGMWERMFINITEKLVGQQDGRAVVPAGADNKSVLTWMGDTLRAIKSVVVGAPHRGRRSSGMSAFPGRMVTMISWFGRRVILGHRRL